MFIAKGIYQGVHTLHTVKILRDVFSEKLGSDNVVLNAESRKLELVIDGSKVELSLVEDNVRLRFSVVGTRYRGQYLVPSNNLIDDLIKHVKKVNKWVKEEA